MINRLIHSLHLWVALLLLCFCLPGMKPQVVVAQAPDPIREITVDTSTFPKMQVGFSYLDATGNFINNLTPGDVSFIEGEDIIPAGSLKLDQPGIRFTIAINVSRDLGRQYAQVPLFTPVLAALNGWTSAAPVEARIDLGIVTNTEINMPANDMPEQWRTTITRFEGLSLAQYDSRISALQDAVNSLIDSSGLDQRKKVLLYISGVPTAYDIVAYKGIAELAVGHNIRVIVWALAPQDAPFSMPVQFGALQELAGGTGGTLFHFTGAEVLPDINSYLDPLRFRYLAEYQSRIDISGPNEVAVMLQMEGQEVVSEPASIYLDIQAPKPIFLAPPAEFETSSGEPLKFKILLEFPDDHPRDLKASRLLMDGAVVAENVKPPFDTFEWQVDPAVLPGEHRFKVEVEDILGLKANSIETPVDLIQVNINPGSKGFSSLPSWILPVFAGLVGLVLIGFFVVRAIRAGAAKHGSTISATAPLVTELLGKRPATEKRQTRPRPRAAEESVSTILQKPIKGASLIRISQEEIWTPSDELLNAPRPYAIPFIPLGRWEVRIGTDVTRNTVRIADPSMDTLHAKILPSDGKKYTILDMDSVAGTWVNFERVSSEGTDLKEGDIVQLGAVTFRFENNKKATNSSDETS